MAPRRVSLPKTFKLLKRKTSKPRRQAIVNSAQDTDIRKIVEVCVNALHGNIPLSVVKKRALQRHRNSIIKVAHCGKNTPKARRVIVQEGGFLPLLISTLGSLIVGAIFA
jgi:hypothetical protein